MEDPRQHHYVPSPPSGINTVYRKPLNLVEGLIEEEVTTYEETNPHSVPLFEMDMLELLSAPAHPALQPTQLDDVLELLSALAQLAPKLAQPNGTEPLS